jgi:hypothetical protein
MALAINPERLLWAVYAYAIGPTQLFILNLIHFSQGLIDAFFVV